MTMTLEVDELTCEPRWCILNNYVELVPGDCGPKHPPTELNVQPTLGRLVRTVR